MLRPTGRFPFSVLARWRGRRFQVGHKPVEKYCDLPTAHCASCARHKIHGKRRLDTGERQFEADIMHVYRLYGGGIALWYAISVRAKRADFNGMTPPAPGALIGVTFLLVELLDMCIAAFDITPGCTEGIGEMPSGMTTATIVG